MLLPGLWLNDSAGIMIEFLSDVNPETIPLPGPERLRRPKVDDFGTEFLVSFGVDCPEADRLVRAVGESNRLISERDGVEEVPPSACSSLTSSPIREDS